MCHKPVEGTPLHLDLSGVVLHAVSPEVVRLGNRLVTFQHEASAISSSGSVLSHDWFHRRDMLAFCGWKGDEDGCDQPLVKVRMN